ncbi:MAG: alpha/beta hydrolase [Bacteroidetes bacterium]|nr:alpha/beta hydrolase [Bacteroidota bacterium]
MKINTFTNYLKLNSNHKKNVGYMRKISLLSLLLISGFVTFALNPSRDYAITPSDYGMKYEDISIPTEDNLTLIGWFFKSTETNSYKIMIISDDGDGNMADNIELVSNFLSLGYNVITYDYRGYGKSSDFNIKKDFFIYSQFQKDIEATLAYVKKFQSKMRNIHLYGLGIGAGLSLAIGANHTEVGRIIADSPYSNFEEMKKTIKEANGTDALFPLGYNKYFLEPTFALESKGGTLAGILFIAGENEKVFSSKIVKKLSNIRSSISTVYIVKGATLSTTFSSNKTKYFEEIKNFVK